MRRYYFHYRDPDERLLEDRIGSRHENLAAVEREAQLQAKDILSEELDEGGSPFVPRCMEVENEAGKIVLYLPFWAAVRSVAGPRAEARREQ